MINNIQYPGAKIGRDINTLPKEVRELYDEARSSFSVNAFTASVLCSRKLLMNIAVNQGAEVKKTFQSYVDYLVNNHYTPPNSKPWVDYIRKVGNIATHEIPSISKDDAEKLLDFVEMILLFIYEYPIKITQINESL
jgi:hypothetical protein